MVTDWQISLGDFTELFGPALFALGAVLSTAVLFDARRAGFRAYAVVAWTLLTLLSPPVFFPLYLAARLFTQRVEPARLRLRFALPFLYAATVAGLGAAYFYREYRSFDGHLARANYAKLRWQRERTIRELRAALRLRDDPHTRKLLGVELIEAGRYEEALGELRAAEAGGDPDERLPFHIASALDALKRTDEAAANYRRFLAGPLCLSAVDDKDCAAASERLAALAHATSRA